MALSACRTHFLPGISLKFRRQLRVCPFQPEGRPAVQDLLFREEKAEFRPEIMVGGYLVVIAVAFRSAAREPDGNPSFPFRELFPDHAFPESPVIFL